MAKNGDTDDRTDKVLRDWRKDVDQDLNKAAERIRRRLEEEQRRKK